MSDYEKANQNSIPALDKFHEVEVGKVFDAMISLHNLRSQVFTLLATVDVGAIGIGLSSQKAGVIVAAGVTVWIALLFDIIIVGILARFYYRALKLEAKYAPNESETFLTLLFMDELVLQRYFTLKLV